MHCVIFLILVPFETKLKHKNIKLTLTDQLGDKFVPFSGAKYEFMCNDCNECHDSSPHIKRAVWIWRGKKEDSQEVSEAHTNAPTLPCLYAACKTRTQAESCLCFSASYRHGGMPRVQTPCHFISTPPSSELGNGSIGTGLHLSAQTHHTLCFHMHATTQSSNTYTQHSHQVTNTLS